MYRLVFVARRRKRGFRFILRKKESGRLRKGREMSEKESARKKGGWVDGWNGWGQRKRSGTFLMPHGGTGREKTLRIFHGECKFGLKYHGKM